MNTMNAPSTLTMKLGVSLLLLAALVANQLHSKAPFGKSRAVQRSSRGLKGSKISNDSHDSSNSDNDNKRELQNFNFNFTGATLMGGNTGGGSVSNGGSAETTTNMGQATSSGEGNFTVTGGSSGFISSNQFGNVMGSSNGGSSGQSIGQGTSSDVGESNFTGSVMGQGNNTFGGQLSGITFLQPEPVAPAADTGEGDAAATTTAPVSNNNGFGIFGIPVATGNNGGFAGSLGTVDSEGSGMGMGTAANASSTGVGNTFGSSELIVTSIFGIAGGTASGNANGTSGTVGMNAMPGVLGNFALNGTSVNSFNNIGSGFLTAGSLGGGPVASGGTAPAQFNFNPTGRLPQGGNFQFGSPLPGFPVTQP